MKIYFAYPRRGYDFQSELYAPLRASALNNAHEIYLPHETDENINSKEITKTCDVVCTEVSQSTMGVGIEFGWADAFGKQIFCFYWSANAQRNAYSHPRGLHTDCIGEGRFFSRKIGLVLPSRIASWRLYAEPHRIERADVLYKAGSKISGSSGFVAKDCIAYASSHALIGKVGDAITHL